MSNNDKAQTQSLNRSLNYLLAAQGRNAFKAVISDDGTGHYSSISDAVDAGETFLFMKNGSYNEDSDIELQGVTIIGQSSQGVKLTLTDATIILTDNDNSTTTGTIAPTRDDKTIAGTGSSFSVVEDDTNKYLFSDMFLAEIDSVSDNTNMELKAKFFGPTLDQDGAAYSLDHQTFSTKSFGSSIENISILHILTSTNTCIELQGIRNTIKNVHFLNTNNASTFISTPRNTAEIAVYSVIQECKFEGGTVGIKFFNSKFATVRDCTFFGCDDNCIELTVNTFATSIYNTSFTGCTRGVNLSGNALYTLIANCNFAFTSFEAIIFDRIGAELFLTISTCVFKECYPTSRTIFADGSFVKIIKNTFSNSTNIIVIQGSDDIHIKDNIFSNWQTRAIVFDWDGPASRAIITGNSFIAESAGSVTESGLLIYGDHHVISNNQFKYIEEEALKLNARNSIVSNNSFDNCGDKNIQVIGDHNTISVNTFEDSTNAIIITGHENIITSNHIEADKDTAIFDSTGDRNIISCNRIENSTTNGIHIDFNADKIIVTNNIALTSGGTNILNNGTNTSVGNNIDS